MIRRTFSAFLFLALLAFAAHPPRPINLTLRDLTGHKVQLRAERDHIVVLNFWATWCGPCNEETPRLVALDRQYQPQRVIFIGASLDGKKTRAAIPVFIRRYRLPYPVWIGATGNDLARLKLGDAVPDTIIVDPAGVIRFRLLGELRPAELQARLDWLLQGEHGPAPAAMVVHLGR